MARNLRNTLRAHPPLRAGPWDWAAVERSRSVREFDAAFTTKHFGFGSVEAYYRAATLRDKLARVRVPLLCLCAADDPFQPLDGKSPYSFILLIFFRNRNRLPTAFNPCGGVCSDPGGGGGGEPLRGAGGDGARRPHRVPGGLVADARAARPPLHSAAGAAVLRRAAAPPRPARHRALTAPTPTTLTTPATTGHVLPPSRRHAFPTGRFADLEE